MRDSTGSLHDLTQEMNETTKGLGENTKKVAELTDRMDKQTAEMYRDLRQGDSLNARRAGLKAMTEAEEPARKISEAAKYFMSFEYQVWTGIGHDDAANRLELAASAAREFMKDVQGFLAPGEEAAASPLAAPMGPVGKESANREQDLNALSVAMHMLNPKQEILLKEHKDLKEMSMYVMIGEALSAGRDIALGAKKPEDFPQYVREILVYENLAKLLMQVRYNYLGAMTVSRVSNIRSGALSYVGMRYFNFDWTTFKAKRTWMIDISKLGLVEVNELARYVKGAMQVNDAMLSVGMIPSMDEDLKAILEKARFSAETRKLALEGKDPKNKASVTAQAVAEFVKVFDSYRESAGIKDPVDFAN
jgi:hypothetical protein